MKNQDLLTNVLIAGSGGAFIISTFLATVVFDKANPNSTALPEPELEMGTAVQVTEQHIEVFMDAVLLTQTSVDILNIVKMDEENNEESGTIVDLFPVGAPARGRGTLEFRIKVIPADQFPALGKRNQITVPMAYVREETLNEFMKSVMKLMAIGIKTAGLMAWMGVFFAIGCILAGGVMIYLDGKKTPVEAVEDDDD